MRLNQADKYKEQQLYIISSKESNKVHIDTITCSQAAESAVNTRVYFIDKRPNATHREVHIIPILSSIYSQAAPKPKTHKDKLSPSQI
jgi:hypothetical protein